MEMSFLAASKLAVAELRENLSAWIWFLILKPSNRGIESVALAIVAEPPSPIDIE